MIISNGVDRKHLLKFLAGLMFLIFIVNSLALKFYWYYSIWYLDIIMHFLGGFWVGLFALYFFRFQTLSLQSILKILIFVLLVGIGWEIFEAVMDNVVAENSFNALDTASDIFFDLVGGALAVFYFFKRIGRISGNGVQ